ncbi:hypothetical protein CGRA01v4_06227 [Colletotrichum graminicola]|uniref:Uncharacterized protein n=1 Tax=Colletotrichum graminicola (strain M1.001 / M2 / FGSC 10212) TaxID=645133 RepID=E3QX18_COLGM|nr:uncharacterized protein GLRG_10550 [Colletotrichum graminicola M1.001]EFQ35406.1 hypothetical protein GLRG_10550 [Colletotrichum graminicola M1.001]WDK14946.1 hypothetical protein CGRA01v4_06227 [Colletotrichum graminicola]
MQISSPRHRRGGAPNPIRIRRQSNSPLFAGRSPAPWSPMQPDPLSGRSTNFSPFTVSPVSMTTDCERELSPSDVTPLTPRLTEYLAGYGWAEDGGSRRESVESRTGGVPETPLSTPVDAFSPTGFTMAMRGRREAMRELMGTGESVTSPRSPGWRGGGWRSLGRMPNIASRIIGSNGPSRETAELSRLYGRVVEIVDESEGLEHMISDENGVSGRVVEMENETDEVAAHTSDGFHAAALSVYREGGGHTQPISWWKYPWVVLMLVLFMLFVPSYKDIF